MKYELPSTELIVIEENNYLKFGEYLNDMQCDDTKNKLCLDDLEYVKKLQQENKQLKEEKRKVTDYINKHCVNEKISKEVGYKCYTMADTNELEKIMKILGDK